MKKKILVFFWVSVWGQYSYGMLDTSFGPDILMAGAQDTFGQLGPNSFVRAECDKKKDQCGECAIIYAFITANGVVFSEQQKKEREKLKRECLDAVHRIGFRLYKSQQEISAEQALILKSRPPFTWISIKEPVGQDSSA
jgi:hypothetical protein